VGTLISVAGFALIFWAIGRLLPLIPRLEALPWFRPASSAIVLLAFATGPWIRLRKQRLQARGARPTATSALS
jgi:hypothetical protein